MDSSFDSTDRRAADYLLFALAFIGFMILVGGIIVSSPTTTIIGILVLLVAILCFRRRPGPEA